MKRFLIGTLWFSSLLLPVQGENPVDLLTAENYVILAKSGITNVPESAITGDIAVSPITFAAMTGFDLVLDSSNAFSTSVQIVGEVFAADYFGTPTPQLLTTAVLDMQAAYINAAERPNPDAGRIDLGAGILDGVVFGGPATPLTPGVYTFSSFVTISGDLFFEGSDTDVFIIQISGYMTQAANFKVILLGGALTQNIFWQVAGYVSLMAGAHMEGIILCATAVTMITGSSLNGRILAQTAVTLQMVTINAPQLVLLPAISDAPSAAPSSSTAPTALSSISECTTPSRIRRFLQSTLFERWDIAEPIFTYESLGFILDFEVNEYINDVEQVKYTMFDKTCNEPYTGNGLSGNRGLSFTNPGDGKHFIDIVMEIDSSTISTDAEVYSEAMVEGMQTATVDFCIRFSLNTPPIAGDMEANFLEIVVILYVDLSDGFQIGELSVAPLNRCVNEAAQEFFVEGYFCEEGNEPDADIIAPVHNQGALIKICVRPVLDAREDFFIRMLRISSFTFERDTISQPAIVDGAAASSGLTELFCTPGYAICHFETILFASFYQTPGAVGGSGIADMQFGGEDSPGSVSPKSRRLLRENRDLQAAEQGVAPASAFDLEVTIVPAVDTVFSAASSSGGLFAMALATAAAAGAMVLW
jgi:hypothetical protein